MTEANTRSERRDARRVRRATARASTPPRARHWGAMGRATVLAPLRVTHPECIWVGDDVAIMDNVNLSVVHAFADIAPRLVIEDGVTIGRGCGIGVVGEVVIARGATLGDFCLVADTYHPYEVLDRLPAVVRPTPIRIGEGAVLGGHVVVLPGVTVGAGAYVEHHSVISRDVPPGAVIAPHAAPRGRAAS